MFVCMLLASVIVSQARTDSLRFGPMKLHPVVILNCTAVYVNALYWHACIWKKNMYKCMTKLFKVLSCS